VTQDPNGFSDDPPSTFCSFHVSKVCLRTLRRYFLTHTLLESDNRNAMHTILSQFHGEKIYSCWISQRCEIVRPALTGPSSLRAWWKQSSERQYFRAFASIVYPPYSLMVSCFPRCFILTHILFGLPFTVHFLTCWIDDVH
jgi:hypothetical protein